MGHDNIMFHCHIMTIISCCSLACAKFQDFKLEKILQLSWIIIINQVMETEGFLEKYGHIWLKTEFYTF